jgi:hypothetical protein
MTEPKIVKADKGKNIVKEYFENLGLKYVDFDYKKQRKNPDYIVLKDNKEIAAVEVKFLNTPDKFYIPRKTNKGKDKILEILERAYAQFFKNLARDISNLPKIIFVVFYGGLEHSFDEFTRVILNCGYYQIDKNDLQNTFFYKYQEISAICVLRYQPYTKNKLWVFENGICGLKMSYDILDKTIVEHHLLFIKENNQFKVKKKDTK